MAYFNYDVDSVKTILQGGSVVRKCLEYKPLTRRDITSEANITTLIEQLHAKEKVARLSNRNELNDLILIWIMDRERYQVNVTQILRKRSDDIRSI
jgi:hypothetical protein